MDFDPGNSEKSRGVRRRKRHTLPLTLRRTVYEWIAILFLLASPVIGIFLFGAVRIWSIGPLMFLSFAGAAMCFARPLFVPELRSLKAPVSGWWWLLLLAYSMAMSFRSVVPYESKIELLKILSYVAAYWAWTDLAGRPGRWKGLLGLFIFAVSLIAWYAVIQHCHGSNMVLNLERPEQYGMRASGTYFCPNHFAHLIELVIPVCLALVWLPAAGFPLRMLAGYGLVLCLPVMYLTQSRSGWIGTAVGLSVTALAIAWRRSRRAFVIMLLLIPLLGGALAGGLWTFSPMVRMRVKGALLSSPDGAVQSRLQMWKDTIAMIRDNPWLGYGPGTYVWSHLAYKQWDEQLLVNYAHNEYLHTMADYGLIGFVLFAAGTFWLVLKLFLRIRRVERDKDACLIAALLGCIAASLAHAFFDFNFHLYSNNHFLVLVAGVLMAALYSSTVLKAKPLSAGSARLIFGGVTLALLVFALLTAQVFFSYGFHLLGEQRRENLELDEAEGLFQRARRIDSANWRPYLGLAHIYQTRSFWDLDTDAKREDAQKALLLYEQALERNPLDAEALFGLAKVYNTIGDAERALEYMQQAVRKNPSHVFYHSHLGLQLRRMGRYEEALAVFSDAATRWNTDMIRINVRFLKEKVAELKKEREPVAE